jgi:hypothetical protein
MSETIRRYLVEIDTHELGDPNDLGGQVMRERLDPFDPATDPRDYTIDWREIAPPRIEILVVRDPDGDTDLMIWIDGQRTEQVDTYEVDAGRGYPYSEWRDARDYDVERASVNAKPMIAAAFDDPPGREYIEGWPDSEETTS